MSFAVSIYDTTLRDGAQGEGISFSLEDKLKIAQRLDAFGAHYIEGGWPGSNAKDVDFFRRIRSIPLKQARVAAFGSTRRAKTTCEADAQVALLLDAETPVVTIVGKSWDLHVHHVLETTLDENLAMICDTVRYLKSQGRTVFYDAEHFFDGIKANEAYALACVAAAQEAGADAVVLCDTNGGSMPWEVEEIVARTRAHLAEREGGSEIGIHTHDDAGVAVANALAGVRAGATQVQGTLNGIGERVGNCNLCSLIPNLQLKLGARCVEDEQLKTLSELSRFASETANLAPNPRQPYVGASAFAHKGGIHVAAVMKVEHSYQHIDPTLVGNERRVLVSELSGRGNLVYKAQEFGVDASKEEVQQVLVQVKELENRGFYFEGAEASVALMLHRLRPGYQRPFEMIDFMVVVEHRQGRGIFAEANVKVKVGDEIAHTAAEGNGPVNALDKALRKALLPHYPRLAGVTLADYKVRILDGDAATGATTRVIIDTRNGHRAWSTVGSSPNIIESSWQALADSMEYALLSE
ncbi:MAG: citramalate synthase [Anaerolineae bacterium]|jgi:2-isopropylmalate synthase|nr:citramalate synthase [Anaerolineae bacterium]